MQRTRLTSTLPLVALLGGVLCAAPAGAQEDRLSALGARATTGAAPGYVEDAVCGRCHADIFVSYQDVGMARSFRRAGNASEIEAFGEEFFHEASQRYYRISSTQDGLTFHRYQRDADGKPINDLELPVSWVMGSGNRARSYLHQNDWGEMFLLPLSWYAESQTWGMSPGFEAADHEGIGRGIQRECMFCHNAYPEVVAGSDFPYSPDLFPKNLPEGTGCQRCHGPGAGHIDSVLAGEDVAQIRARIVNPANLPAERRDEVCFQCHLLPTHLVSPVRRFERSIYSFRPGQKLSDYLVNIDAGERGVPESERFEINHHGYRLYRSSCFRESEGQLACISCHDPHRKTDSRELRSTVAAVCSDCHAAPAALHGPETEFDAGECVSCHMPTRRTRDVIEVTMTDHWIATGPFDPEQLVAPLTKENLPVTNVRVLPLPESPQGTEAEIYTLVATLRAKRSVNEVRARLAELLPDAPVLGVPPLVELATSSFATGRFSDAERAARQIIETDRYLPAAYKVLGVSFMAQNLRRDTVQALQQSLRLQPDPEVHFNLAAAYIRYAEPELAKAQLEAALELRPTMAVAWKYLGLIYRATGRREQARQALVRSIQIEPRDLQAYGDLVTLLREQGEAAEANRYIELRQRLSEAMGSESGARVRP